MLTEKEIFEIREHLEKAVNPLFFFDNDMDGMASFLVLARAYGKGKGVAIKSSPDLNSSYIRKIEELNPDYIFILDKPLVSKEFIDEVRKLNLPIVWIDHHDIENPIRISECPKNSNIGENFCDMGIKEVEGVHYYNPKNNDKKNQEPTTYLAWRIAGKKQDLWLALMGCISDNFFPDFASSFSKDYPELWGKNIKSAFHALYETEIGKMTRVLSFGLKDRTSNVVRMIKLLLKISSPLEILDENNQILHRFNQIDKKYQKLIEKAKEFAKEKLLYFQYGGDLSLSADIANELSYRFPGRTIVVVYISGNRANISIRGKKARELTLKAIEGFQNATGGGHEEATGAKLDVADLPEFKKRIESLVNKN